MIEGRSNITPINFRTGIFFLEVAQLFLVLPPHRETVR